MRVPSSLIMQGHHAPHLEPQPLNQTPPIFTSMARTKKKARKSTGPFYSKMFLEEALNFSPRKGGGYYQAVIHQKLDGDKYEIIRKLGYGRRSSTWLVLRARDPEYFAVEIFTVAASERANTAELPIIKEVDKVSRSSSLELPTFHGSFWEESRVGSHLRFVVNPLSTSIKDLQLDAKNQRLPVHVVQRIIWSVSNSLNGLHDVKIMHGRTFLIHDLFHPGVIFNPLLKRKTHFSQLRPKSNTFRFRTCTILCEAQEIYHCTVTASETQF